MIPRTATVATADKALAVAVILPTAEMSAAVTVVTEQIRVTEEIREPAAERRDSRAIYTIIVGQHLGKMMQQTIGMLV
ncbi:MAG: hypothetical protein ACI4DU_00420 [Lachnospiraceae bacterium]